MTEDEMSTEDKLETAFDLYELDCENWDSSIFLDELERMYAYRERINKIILRMKTHILGALKE